MNNRVLLQINVTANAGSTGKIAEQIGICAIREGFDSYIAYGKRANPSNSHLIKIGTKIDFYNHVIQSRLFDNHGLASKSATSLFLKQVEEIKPSIIHLHNIHNYFINYKLLFSYLKTKDIPVVWTLHDCWSFTGHCAHFDHLNCDNWKYHCDHCPGLGAYPSSLFVDRSRKNFDEKYEAFTSILDRLTIVPVSRWLESFVRQSFLKDAKIDTVHNGIDLQTFIPTCSNMVRDKYGIPHDKKMVLGVASPWSVMKGIQDFFSLRQMLSEEFIIVMVGLSDRQMKDLPMGVVGIKRTENQKDLSMLYSTADVFVNPTYEDNYPTTNLEALACGCPIVVYNTGGTPESVTKETGYVVEKGDVSSLKKTIMLLSSDDRDRLREICRKWAIDNCNADVQFSEYVKLYNSLL